MCLHGSALNIEPSNLTSIHFKTSIQRRRDGDRECKTGFFFFVDAERSLILHTLLFTPHTKL